MSRSEKGYLLIEVILGLSIFALFAGGVTQMFLIGLQLYQTSVDDPNEAVVAVALINRIQKGKEVVGSLIELPFHYKNDQEEMWKLKVEESHELKGIFPKAETKLYALKVSIGRTSTNANTSRNPLVSEEKSYEIFRCISA
ncbi:MAG: hypothetical protein LBH08_03465 [Puniceicoccales bacterium]|jgi:hypothetical protein|nr:hypothetical protein [Puniceicoccales bacterium]